jgi:DNA-directed RNA polymerase subunit RPC12/RpoP
VTGLLLSVVVLLAAIAIALVSWNDDACGSCGREFELDETRRRRRVPSAGGKTRYVCQDCADVIDAQATLIARQEIAA